MILNKKISGTKRLLILLCLINLIVITGTVSAGNMTIDQLLNTYSYDFNNGDLKIASYSDTMFDADSNNQNDTFMVTLAMNTTNAGIYTLIVDLMGNNGLISNETIQSLSSGITNLNISFSSKLLSKPRYNYTARVYNASDSLVYRKDKMLTSIYTNYETGISIISVNDKSVSNDYLQVNLTLNVTESQLANITGYLKYNGSYISSKSQFLLSPGVETIELKFDNETIKRTHYNGNYILDYVEVADQIFYVNYTTSSYNYADFAHTSYFVDYTSSEIDTNDNNLSEYLRINITLDIITSGTYTLDVKAYDLYGEYVANSSSSQSLSTGTNNAIIDINGTLIYASKTNGPYSLEYVKMTKSGETIDIAYQPFTTDIYYYDDFERPPLADLIPSITIIDDSTANVTVTNLGEVPAFNLIVDIFDDENLSVTKPISYLNVSKSETISVNLSVNYSVLTTIVDFNNYIDESNESNNIVQYIKQSANLTISSLTNITINNTHMIFQFIINNTGYTTLNDINWTLNPGDGSSVITSGANTFSLASGKTALIYVEYNYSTESVFVVNATASSGELTAHKTLAIYLGNATPSILDIYDFSVYDVSSTHKVFSFGIKNIGEAQNLTDVSWSLNTGTETIDSDSQYSFNLTPNNFSLVYVEYNYTQTGDFETVASASSGVNEDSESLNVDIPDIEVSNLSLIFNDSLHRVFFFAITNTLLAPMDYVNWSFDTDDSNVISAEDTFGLNSSKDALIIIEYNYSSTGTYTVNATAINGSLTDSEYYTFTIS